MKHYFYATCTGYGDDGVQFFRGHVFVQDEQKLPGTAIRPMLESIEGLELVAVSYLGCMSEEEFGSLYPQD
ncbi:MULTISPECIES: hypothetical protein [Pseudomonas]|uniref:hypothetical protein n=1 Tax=Pseudomonas TaxID=286 RepID=UPI00125FE0E4|nr:MULTISPECIES: hypothetical protein [Pseudomonas]KAB5622742.1 hypothetical protein F7234_14645 [Pseudomonas putida]MBH3458704.1 hypothetical protein [Pseudomonas putida]MBK0058976.1 hypothetical protein [Pseudomonas sp. S44]